MSKFQIHWEEKTIAGSFVVNPKHGDRNLSWSFGYIPIIAETSGEAIDEFMRLFPCAQIIEVNREGI